MPLPDARPFRFIVSQLFLSLLELSSLPGVITLPCELALTYILTYDLRNYKMENVFTISMTFSLMTDATVTV